MDPLANDALRDDDDGFAASEMIDLALRFDVATRAPTRACAALTHRDRVFITLAGHVWKISQSRQRLSSRQFFGLPIASPRMPERNGRLGW